MTKKEQVLKQHGAGKRGEFVVKLFWHTLSGVAAALMVLAVQVYVQTSTASSLTSRVSSLESQTQQELAGIHRELERMNATLEKLAGR